MRPHLGAVVLRCRDVGVRWWPRVRVGLASYWTVGFGWAAMTALHLRWLARSHEPGEVLSGYGTGLVLLGVWIGSRPYLRAGVAKMIEDGLPDGGAGVFGGPTYDASVAELHRTVRPGLTLDVWAERVVAVSVVLLGTFLNGYGAPLARRWGLHG